MKKQFADLASGTPKRMDPHVEPRSTRKVQVNSLPGWTAGPAPTMIGGDLLEPPGTTLELD